MTATITFLGEKIENKISKQLYKYVSKNELHLQAKISYDLHIT